ncbi:hypothetical protein KP79_PYT08209 [Mizuhopecten yessoensis]|uniref:Uncharacterized protein n=1 Tax=Mizuhopecten yessoensis TaxID=6573 RepID=A0A210Q3X7_MIZYE|nr:hypothetical protein KP79_PYT08209 [Mizuhopecten yessoensis]
MIINSNLHNIIMERINATVEDDVTYQRIKLLPQRSHHYSVHRRLSWQCQKDVQQFEKDAKLATFDVTRGQTAVRDRLSQLKKTKRELLTKQAKDMKGSHQNYRRSSCPILESHELQMVGCNDEVKNEFRNGAKPEGMRRILHRSDTVNENGDRELLLAIRRFTSPNIKACTDKDVTPNTENADAIQEG